MTLRWFIGCAKRISRSSNNLVEQILIIEIKAGRAIALEHEAQILGYLRSAKLEHGLLINFGAPKFEIRKFAWSQMMTHRPLFKRH